MINIHVHTWQRDDETWLSGIVDPQTSDHVIPDQDHEYTVYSILDPDLLIHCYWLPVMPPDNIREEIYPVIAGQVIRFVVKRTKEEVIRALDEAFGDLDLPRFLDDEDAVD